MFDPNTDLSDINFRTTFTAEQLKTDYKMQQIAKNQIYLRFNLKHSTEQICEDLDIPV